VGSRLFRRIPLGIPVPFPVNSVLPGRRNNPADHAAGIRPLAVYNPIHYQEYPELFMEFISSLTGRSPSTTGAGSEGALTKGPFNPMPAIIDLNNALVSYLLTGNPCFTTSAGYIGPKYRFDHDISLLIPEVWSRMFVEERDPAYLIREGYLESVKDFEYEGRTVLASRLGYRITDRFITAFFGRIFSDPTSLFTEEMLRPEQQHLRDYVDGIDNIVSTQQRIAELYFVDNTVELACPPLKALLHIMAYGEYQGLTINSNELRQMFTRDHLLASEWYAARVQTQQTIDQRLWQRHVSYLKTFLREGNFLTEDERTTIAAQLQRAEQQLQHVQSAEHLASLFGALGADPHVIRRAT